VRTIGAEARIENLSREERSTILSSISFSFSSGKLEVAQHIANHESPRTTKLYGRRQDEISLDEVERIAI
jgi:hypothetical protein